MSKRFESKVVLVTGGTSGLGAAAAAFAREGAKVVVAGRRRALYATGNRESFLF